MPRTRWRRWPDVRVDILIVGAGPTGLGAAWRLDRLGHGDWLLCEAEREAGGLAGSVIDDDGFTWDLGGHVQFSHYDYFDRVMDDVLGPDGWLTHDRESWVWLRGRFVPYPFQLNLHRLPAADAARALRGLEEAQQEPSAPAPANFGEWIDRTFGGGLARIFMRPYNAKVWAREPERMSWHWVGDRVAVVDLQRVRENMRLNRDEVSWGPNNRFRFPRRGGTGAIWRTLAGRLSEAHPGRLLFQQRLTSLDTVRHVASFASGLEIRYERLLSTLPLVELVRISDLAEEGQGAAGDLEYSSTHVIGVGLHGQAQPEVATKCWMYFPEADCPFYRVTHFSRYSPANVPDPARQWSLMAEVSESIHRPLRHADVVADTLDGMINTRLIRSRTDVHHTWHRRLEYGYPVPSLARDRALRSLLPMFESRQVRSRGRFGAWMYEVSNQDHSFAQGVEAIGAWFASAEEETIGDPARVNERRPAAVRMR
jgi:protoporphyrinogen oxidase